MFAKITRETKHLPKELRHQLGFGLQTMCVEQYEGHSVQITICKSYVFGGGYEYGALITQNGSPFHQYLPGFRSHSSASNSARHAIDDHRAEESTHASPRKSMPHSRVWGASIKPRRRRQLTRRINRNNPECGVN